MLLYFFLLFLCFLVYQNEHVRFQNSRIDCQLQHERDAELLMRDVCQNLHDRMRFRMQVDCEGAERRLRVNAWVCAIQSWTEKSSITGFIHMFLGSYWAMLGLILPIAFWWLHLYMSKKRDKRKTDELVETIKRLR